MKLNKTFVSVTQNTKETDTESILLKEVTSLKRDVNDCCKYFKEAFDRIQSEAEDIKFSNSTGNTFKIGVDSVKPLIEIKTLAAEIFSNSRNSEATMLHKGIDFTPFENNIIELRKRSKETREIINFLGLVTEAAVKIVEQKNQINGNSNESSTSCYSIASSDPSISYDILTNAATSSPI